MDNARWMNEMGQGMQLSVARMCKALTLLSVVATATVCMAADPVAEGFPAWEGLEADNRICGRALCPSDMRHKVLIVAEIEPTDEKSTLAQILAVSKIARLDSTFALSSNTIPWERKVMPHGVSVVVVNYGGKGSADMIKGVIKKKFEEVGVDIPRMNALKMPIYSKGVMFPGAPQAPGGKRPFVYVMGPEGTEPLFSGVLDGNSEAAVISAVKKAASSLPEWRQFYGPIEETRYFKNFSKALDPKTAKSLDPVVQKIKKGILSKDSDVAKEAQILFDAIEQTRSDLVYRISIETVVCPHRALYDLSLLSRYFPSGKKEVSAYVEKLKANPDAAALGEILKDVLAWSDPEFKCKSKSEAKKIVTKLNAMKKNVEKLKGSKFLSVQNGAFMLSGEIDQLIENIPMKVVSK